MVQPSQLSLMQHQKVHQFSFIPLHHCQYLCPGRVALQKGGCSLRRCYLSNVHVNVRSFHDPLKTHRISPPPSFPPKKYFGTSFEQFRSGTSKSPILGMWSKLTQCWFYFNLRLKRDMAKVRVPRNLTRNAPVPTPLPEPMSFHFWIDFYVSFSCNPKTADEISYKLWGFQICTTSQYF